MKKNEIIEVMFEAINAANENEWNVSEMVNYLKKSEINNPEDLVIFEENDEIIALSKTAERILIVDGEETWSDMTIDEYIWTINEGFGNQYDYDLVKEYFPHKLSDIEDEIFEMYKINK